MIVSWRDRRIQQLVAGEVIKGFPSDLVKAARRKLLMLDNAVALEDLR